MRRVLLKVLALLQIIGGAVGMGMGLISLAGRPVPADRMVWAALIIALYGLSLFAGVMLWRDRSVGYVTSAVVQILQLLKVATPQFAFVFSIGGDVSVISVVHQDAAGHRLRGITVYFQPGPFATIEVGRLPGAPEMFGVSVLSCLGLILLRKGRHHTVADAPISGEGAPVPSGEAKPAPVGGHADGPPDWVFPFWLKVAVVLLILVVISCAGLLMS